MDYQFKDIEQRWQQFWAENQTFKADNNSAKPKYYVLDMFPYPSGAGLHVGHPLGYIASDIFSRYKRLKGFNVLHPMGYDSFGLPAEQYAIQTGQHPAITTETNIATYRRQLDQIGFSFDWSREVRTSSPDFYKWTQWIFMQLFKSWYNKAADKAESIEKLVKHFEQNGSAGVDAVCDEDIQPFSADRWKEWNYSNKQKELLKYRLTYLRESTVNWCAALGTVLANDEVKDGFSERGGYPVEQKKMKQWSMRITAYAERLLQGLDTIDWPEPLKEMQRNWIGKSVGASVKFTIDDLRFTNDSTHHSPLTTDYIEVFTTRVDTIFGVTFLVLAPEHELVPSLTTPEQKAVVDAYIAQSKKKSELDRMADTKTVSGAFTGSYVINPVNNEKVPLFIADYVLAGYGTGAVMAVPSGDQRDYLFAKHFDLPIIPIIDIQNIETEADPTKEGTYINSDFMNGHNYKEGTAKVIEFLEDKGAGKAKVNFRMRDAIFGRQRYWGEPVPVYFKGDLPHLIDKRDLPLLLPEIDKYLPTETGEPPLGRAADWVNPLNNPKFKHAFDSYRDRHYKDIDSSIKNILGRLIHSKYNVKEEALINAIRVDFLIDEPYFKLAIDITYYKTKDTKKANARRKYLKFYHIPYLQFTIDELQRNSAGYEILKKIENSRIKPQLFEAIDWNYHDEFEYELSTMPGWAGSSWYWYRYMDAHNDKEFASEKAIAYWKDVDLYIGGSEHATGHLLYSRFWNKFLKDMNLVVEEEPFKKLINQGMIQGRSNFVYRLTITEVGPVIRYYYISKSFYDLFEKTTEFTEMLELVKKIGINLNPGVTVTSIAVQDLHVDVNIVENDLLNIDKFKAWREEYRDAEFILENGKYICGVEIEKMSKSKYNVVNPDDLIERYGADTLRMYEMFLGPLEQSKPWNTNGIEGVFKFLRKFWKLFHDEQFNFRVSEDAPSKAELKSLHKIIRKVEEDVERFSFNTSVSSFMIAVNELTDLKSNKRAILQDLVVVLSPYAPHICEELWVLLGNQPGTLSYAPYPKFNPEYLIEDEFAYPISINGKMKMNLNISLSLDPPAIESTVIGNADVQKYLDGKSPKKVIVVKGRIVNIVV